jgi:small subunit ribosomal protein S16
MIPVGKRPRGRFHIKDVEQYGGEYKMVKIRLRRMGAKKAPFYRIVVADSRYPRDGRFIEEIGTYDPKANPAELKVDVERAQAWIKTGAQPTETVKSLLKKAGV